MKKDELKNGCAFELRNGRKGIKIDNTLILIEINDDEIYTGWLKFDNYNEDLTFNAKKYSSDKEWDIMKVNNDVGYIYCYKAISRSFNYREVKWDWIRKTPILTDEENVYLKAVIKPVKDRVKYIIKCNIDDVEYIRIVLNNNIMALYDFKKGTEFRGMETRRQYTLEELEL